MPAMPQIHQVPAGNAGQQQQVQMIPQAPSVWQKLQMGALMGAGVGLSIGFIGGMVQIMRAGPGPKGTLATLSQFMGTSGATFAFFLSIGSVIRTEGGDVRSGHWSLADEMRLQQATSQGKMKVLIEEAARRRRTAAGEA